MKKRNSADAVSTIVGRDASFEGTIDFDGSIRVDGKVTGIISSDKGTVIVGEEAFVEADINVAIAIVRGEVRGKINARKRIEVYPPGRIEGDITAPVISIDTGVVFNGNCEMTARTILSRKNSAESEKNDNAEDTSNVKSFIKTG